MSPKAKRRKMTTRQDQKRLMDDNIESSLLPELFKMILTKAVLVQMHSENTAKHQRDESIFISLASVDFHWWTSIKTRHLNNRIRHFSKVFFQRAKVRSTIIRNNRNFLKEAIDPDKIIFPLKSYGCLTKGQVTFLTRLRNNKEKNHELLFILQNFSSHKYSKFVDCLFTTNQTPAAMVLERGGGTVKVHINYGKATRTRDFEMELVKKLQRMQTENTLILNDLLNVSVKKSLNDVCILHAKQNKGIKLWLLCKTKRSFNQMNSIGLREEDIQEIIQRLIPEHSTLRELQLIQMDYCLASDFAERRLSIRHVGDRENLTVSEAEDFIFSQHVTSLGDKIYVTQESGEISVYWNKYPYKSLNSIVLSNGLIPIQIVSCNINKCLYVSYSANGHILKVEPMSENRVSEWLRCETGYFIISVTCRGDVLVLGIGSEDNELRIITHEGIVKRTITMEDRFSRTQFIQEIMPDIVALSYEKLSELTLDCITVMRLDKNGTVLRNIVWEEEIGCLSSFRYGDLFIGVFEHKSIFGFFPLRLDDNRCVKLQHWTLESKVARDLLTTDDKIISIHFDADQKQLLVLSRYKLYIYHLHYLDEVYN